MIFVGCINFKWADFLEGWLAIIRGMQTSISGLEIILGEFPKCTS